MIFATIIAPTTVLSKFKKFSSMLKKKLLNFLHNETECGCRKSEDQKIKSKVE